MATNLRYPDINGKSTPEQMEQLKSYLYQLVGELNYALENVGSRDSSSYVVGSGGVPIASEDKKDEPTALEKFSEIKGLIIKSADIVNAYYEEINKRLVSSYEALSDFGTYKETTDSRITANAKGIVQSNSRIQDIESVYRDGGKYAAIIKNEGYVKAGFLEDQIYGLEVGQVIVENGEEVFRGFGRFTTERISFFDRNGTETAWLSNRRLKAIEIEATERQQIGGFIDIVDAATGDVKTTFVTRADTTARGFFE